MSLTSIIGAIGSGSQQLVHAQSTMGGKNQNNTQSAMEQFITSSPDYQFRFNEGQRALERSAAAKGKLSSGNLMRDLVSFGQGQAAGAYEAEINRIMQMAGANVGSPSVAGQLAYKGTMSDVGGMNQAMGAIGYGINQWSNPNNWMNPNTQAGMINTQTGYTGGTAGVLSGDEWANW